jgi:hypothetical protein
MHAMLVLPAVVLAFSAPHAHGHTLGVTANEAFRATDSRIERKVRQRLHGYYRGVTGCSAHAPGRQRAGATLRFRRWRCTVELKGSRFPSPCRAEVYVTGTRRRHVLRLHWVRVSRYCRN